MATKGGRRPGAGRKKGSGTGRKPKVLAVFLEAQAEATRAGITPLEHMLAVIRTPLPTIMEGETPEAYMSRVKWHIARQDAMAQAAAPYCSARLQSIETKQNPDQFKEEMKAKLATLDKTEIVRRLAFFLAEAQREKRMAEQQAEVRH